MNLTSLEKRYSKWFHTSFDSFTSLYAEIVKSRDVDLNKEEVSKAMLIRLHSWYDFQREINNFLKKRKTMLGSDFFVETLLFYLKAIFEIFDVKQEIHSEKSIETALGVIRPDISIWKRNDVKAIIECKTQLGWNRHGWKEDFMRKERNLKSRFPNAKAFLVVMTSKNWPGFGDDENVGKKFFTLYNTWPLEIDPEGDLDEYILNSIEPLIRSLIT